MPGKAKATRAWHANFPMETEKYVPLPSYVVVPKQVEIDEKAAYE